MATRSLLNSLLVLVAASALSVEAQTPQDGNTYTVWASVVLNRIGERTPKILNDNAPVLTSTGAQQMYSAGSFFRERYLTPGKNANIYGMSTTIIDADQLYALAYDEQPDIASAQAFMQGLYPPVTPNTTSSTLLDPTAIYNGSYVEAPLHGYQYSQIQSANIYDPNHIFINGGVDCPATDAALRVSGSNTDYQTTQNATRTMYQRLRPLLSNVIVAQGLDFANAYAIYDYVSYQAVHNSSFAEALPQYTGGIDVTSFLTTLRILADQEQQHELANMTAVNQYLNTNTLPLNTAGSISTIAGNFLAAKILANLQISTETQGRYFKLSTIFTDFEPMVSLFSLMSLAHTTNNFTGLPLYASSAVFELYSWSNTTNSSYPDTNSLYVAFHFRNGSDADAQFLSYPAFERGPSQTDMSWQDFNNLMYNIMLDDPGVWCTQCAAVNLFCAAWNSTLSSLIASGSAQSISNSGASTQVSRNSLSPAAAGAVGAIVALAVAALLFALVMLLAGVRFRRRRSRKTSELGGFKGSSKMASDRDLVLPPRTDEEDARPGGHERSGSWEMKGKENTVLPVHQERQRARDDHDEDLRVNPFADPVQARESF